MNRSTPGLPVHHQLPEFTQTHVHRVSDAIQSSHPLPSPSPSALNLSQHHGFFKWVSSLHQVAKVLELQLQHLSFQWIFRTDFLYTCLVGSPCSPRDSQESTPTPQFKSINSLTLGLLYDPTLTSIHGYKKNHSFDYTDFGGKVMYLLFNMLSRFVIAFLPRNKHLLFSWMQSPSAVILEPKKTKSVTVSIVSPSIYHGTKRHDLSFLNVEFEANFFTLLFHFHQEVLQFLFTFWH